jgi:hypothetical protein
MGRYWYAYDTIGNPFALKSYRRQASIPGCLNGPVICSISVRSDGGEYPPEISVNVRQYIADALANNVAEPVTPPGSKFYVYSKNL